MPASNMIQLLRDSTMIEAEHENLCVRSFLKAQLEPPIVWETQFMVFTEFIEALSLIAVQALDVKR